MIGFREMLILTHALAGLCVGGFSGMRHGLFAMVILVIGGSLFGLIAGLLMVHMPRLIGSAAGTANLSHRTAVLLRLSGHLISIGVAVSFWWLCFSLLSNDLSH